MCIQYVCRYVGFQKYKTQVVDSKAVQALHWNLLAEKSCPSRVFDNVNSRNVLQVMSHRDNTNQVFTLIFKTTLCRCFT